MMQKLARAIAHRYPAAWRARYEAEVLALIDAGAVRLRDVIDLLRGCIRERVLALYEPSRHISAYRLISGIALTAFIAVLVVGTFAVSAVPFLLGYGVQRLAGPFPAHVTDAVEWALLPLLALIIWAFIKLFRIQSAPSRSGSLPPSEAAKLGWVLFGCYGGMAFVGGLSSELSFRSSYSSLFLSWLLLTRMWDPTDAVRWPGSDLFETLGRLRVARYDLRWARMELDRCEGIYEGREPGPELRAARAEIERLTAVEADTMAALDAMGYHARFNA
jgi:hypothetical protein